MNKSLINRLPDSPGIYQFLDKNGEIIYVGKSVSVKKRVKSYFASKNLGPKTNLLVSKIKEVNYIKVFSEFEALLLESELIKKNQPFFNIEAKDDKTPLYIKITKDKIPLITTIRKSNIETNEFIKGPFKSAKTAKDILKILRKIFPYCHHKNPKKPCLYVHLGLCSYPYESEEKHKDYNKNIAGIKKILSGKSKILLHSLVKEMKRYSQVQKYEEAQKIKKQIEKIQTLLTTYHTPNEFLERPTLVDDLAISRLEDIKKVLGLAKKPKRIECYDISNIAGYFATGSMAVFLNGVPAKSEYRKFKIKFAKGIDDYKMLQEVLSRRFKNLWSNPDLIVIDGGRGQLNAALSATAKINLKTPVISLAKKFEEIYTQDKILPITLPKESPTRQLVQSLRDEAHRFAISYHKKLREKNFLQSES